MLKKLAKIKVWIAELNTDEEVALDGKFKLKVLNGQETKKQQLLTYFSDSFVGSDVVLSSQGCDVSAVVVC